MKEEGFGLQSKRHKKELEMALLASQRLPGATIVGSTAAKLLVWGKDIGGYMRPSDNVNIATSAIDLAEFASLWGFRVTNLPLTASSKRFYRHHKQPKEESAFPLRVIKFDGVKGQDAALNSVGVFTEYTGVGAISADATSFESSIKLEVKGAGLKVVGYGYLMATQMNPIAYTEKRATTTFYPLSYYWLHNGSESFKSEVMAPAVSFLQEGEEKAMATAEKLIAEKRFADGFTDYAEYVRKIGGFIDTNLKKKFERVTVKVGFENPEDFKQLRRTVVDAFKSYTGGERMMVT